MNKNEIINWFQIIVSVGGFILGNIFLFFTKKINEKQINYASKYKDVMNQKIAIGLSKSYIPILTRIIGLIFIAVFGYRLIEIFAFL